MKSNVGALDRAVRVVFGVVAISLVYVGPQTPLGWIGVIPLVTSVFRVCPFYALFGVDTCRMLGVDTCTPPGA